MDYVILPLAEIDLDEIWIHIAYDNEVAADGVILKIFDAINEIVGMPFIGRSREELLPNIRSFVVMQYVIFYRPLNDIVEIVRVLHGARDIDVILH